MSEIYKLGNLTNYLNQFKIPSKSGKDYTHTSLHEVPSMRASYYIESGYLDDFYKIYSHALDAGEILYLTEKPKSASIIVIDLDFRYKVDIIEGMKTPPRIINSKIIKQLLTAYIRKLGEFVDLSAVSRESGINIYVLQKPGASFIKDCAKDGLHIIIPDIIIQPHFKYSIRAALLDEYQAIFDRAGLSFINSIADIFDEAVIENNNWMLYGSIKPNNDPYMIKTVYKYDGDGDGFALINITKEELAKEYKTIHYVNLFSVRKLAPLTKLYDSREIELKKIVENTIENSKNARIKNQIIQPCTNLNKTRNNSAESNEFIRKLVNILNPKRSENFDEWIRIGWCLRNIDYTLLDVWIEFSKKSSRHKSTDHVDECTKLWENMRDGTLNIGSLHMWAKTDDPANYKIIQNNSIQHLLDTASSGTDHDIANVVYSLYKHRFVSTNKGSRTVWYEFRNHRWKECPTDNHTLINLLSTEVADIFGAEAIKFLDEANKMTREKIMNEQNIGSQSDSDDATAYNSGNMPTLRRNGEDKLVKANTESAKNATEYRNTAEYNEKRADSYLSTKKRLLSVSSKANLMRECVSLFYADGFVEMLDTNPYLMAFNNGVYDFASQEFRPGFPDDYISISTGINYIEYNPGNKKYKKIYDEIDEFLSKVLTKRDVREYILRCFGSFLCGIIREHRFYIFTGEGGNGKSKLINLFSEALGEYADTFNVSLLTNKRVKSNETNTEIVESRSKRFMVLQEPDNGEKIQIGFMKELTGGDKIKARALYKDSTVKFLPQFKMVLTCNHLPEINATDDGTWRRVRVIHFSSKFCDNPDPNNPNEFPKDDTIDQKFKDWREHFMSMLVHYYNLYVTEGGLVEPDDVIACTREYQKANDTVRQYVEDRIERIEKSFVLYDDIYKDYVKWYNDAQYEKTKRMKKPELLKMLEKIMGKCESISKKTAAKDKGWMNYAIYTRMAQIAITEEDEL